MTDERAWYPAEEIARAPKSNVGPSLFVGGVCVRTWLGTAHDGEADDLAEAVRRELFPLIQRLVLAAEADALERAASHMCEFIDENWSVQCSCGWRKELCTERTFRNEFAMHVRSLSGTSALADFAARVRRETLEEAAKVAETCTKAEIRDEASHIAQALRALAASPARTEEPDAKAIHDPE